MDLPGLRHRQPDRRDGLPGLWRLDGRAVPPARAGPSDPGPGPGRLAAWLSALPGLGTWYAGQPAQGVARFLVWLWWLSTAALFWSRPEPVLLLVKVTFLLATVALWVLSGVDAHRLAARPRPLLGPRALAVAAAGLCLLLLAGLLATLGAVRSGIGPAPGLPAGPGLPGPPS